MTQNTSMSMGQFATLACLLEVTAPKPGNVHRGADFEDVTFLDFVVSAAAIGPVFDRTATLSVGELVLQSIEATRQVVNTNTNLGLMLLMAPMAKIDASEGLKIGATRVLSELSPSDAANVYAAIGLASPGGLGKVDQHDVSSSPPSSLLEAMRLAADRDLIAKQYVTAFADLSDLVVDKILTSVQSGQSLTDAIVHTHVSLMAQRPDSLIARKCGPETSEKSALLAGKVLESGTPESEEYAEALADLDFWLRCDGHRRNPGTSADMIGAALFWLLRSGQLTPPWR